MITNLNPTTDGSPVIALTDATIDEVLEFLAPGDIAALFMQVAAEHDFGGWACPEDGGMYAGVDADDVTAALEKLSGSALDAGLDIPWRKAMLIVAATWEFDCYTAG